MYVVVPSIGKLNEANSSLEQEKLNFSQTQDQLISIKNNKKLVQDVEKLKAELADFNVRVPEEDDMAILLVDLNKFASSFNITVKSLNTNSEKSIEIIDPKIQALQAKKKIKRKVSQQILPIQLTEIPIEITVIGFYPDLLNFINAVEHYQRKIAISGVSISDYKDNKNVTSKVEMVISASIYKITRQEVITDEIKSNESSKEES
jgi:Tfp pilus assembly protein PilO